MLPLKVSFLHFCAHLIKACQMALLKGIPDSCSVCLPPIDRALDTWNRSLASDILLGNRSWLSTSSHRKPGQGKALCLSDYAKRAAVLVIRFLYHQSRLKHLKIISGMKLTQQKACLKPLKTLPLGQNLQLK